MQYKIFKRKCGKFVNIKRFSKKKKIIIIVSSCVGVIAIVALSGFLYLNNLLGRINYVPTSTASVSSGVTTTSSSITTDQGVPLVFDKDVLNILLIGTDNRADTTVGGRSDSMIILSINQKSKKIVMTSLMRDTYLPIPDHGSNRINAAYSFGGVGLLLQTIQNNFDIKINNYVTVDFYSFIDIIDKLGGVNIDVSDQEVPVLNSYVNEINKLKGLSSGDGTFSNGGKGILLDGKQALGYSRIRYIGNADFERTERQRIVLTKVFEKLKGQNIIKISSILNILLPDITTNMTKGNLTSLVFNSLTYMNYPLEQDRIPIDGSFKNATINKMDVLTIDFAKNIAELKSNIYGIK
jgi:LCP family protein required for cell wall assembly